MMPSMVLPSASTNLEKNVWADYVELFCLTSQDNEISLSDILEIVRKESPDSPNRGSEDSGEDEDKLHQVFLDVFQYLHNRKSALGDWYPFVFEDEDTLSSDLDRLSLKQQLYVFLLYASNLAQFDKQDQSTLTHEFELLSKSVLKCVFPNYTVEIFGTSAQQGTLFYGGKTIERFERLAKCLNTQVSESTKRNPRYESPAGDGGLDLVGFVQLENDSFASPFIPMCFAQCSCSVDQWKSKQASIQYSTWNQRFANLASYCEFIFVPFSLRGPDGKWATTEEDRIVVIPIDRYRFIHILSQHDYDLSIFKHSGAYETL